MENAYVWVYIFQYIDLLCSIKNFNIFFFLYMGASIFFTKKKIIQLTFLEYLIYSNPLMFYGGRTLYDTYTTELL